MPDPKVRHVVLFRWIEGTTRDDVVALHEAIMELPQEIPEIMSYRGGADLSLTDGTWDYALVADFASEEDYQTYAGHPRHRAAIDRYVSPIVDEVVRVQYAL